ncbi:GPR1/FUN34/yaaH family-domain-containing protein [Hypomontagnella monticulosa]|nr:GPR1/FUN34/yaaH family-domain-containing protein [Hypomontagnella monticulosa]
MSTPAIAPTGRAVDLEGQTTTTTAPHHVPRALGNPAPLGLLSFATTMFMTSLLNLQPRGVNAPNIAVAFLTFFGGVGQFIAGIVEFVRGNTLGATLFSSYGGFNLSYALIYLPGSGIVSAYTDPETGELMPEFDQAVAMYIWAWFIISVIFTVANIRTTWALLGTLFFLDVTLILLAAGLMSGRASCIKASAAIGFVTACFSYWAGAAALYGDGTTPFNIPVGPLKKE